jgi:hypothetical protein
MHHAFCATDLRMQRCANESMYVDCSISCSMFMNGMKAIGTTCADSGFGLERSEEILRAYVRNIVGSLS